MAEQKKKGGRKKKADVIDIGDKPAGDGTEPEAGEPDEQDEEDKESDDGLDADLVAAAGAIDVGDEPAGEDVPEPKVSTGREGSLAKRDPLAAYMA